MQILLFEYIMITKGKQADVKNRVEAARGSVPECLQRDVLFKGAVKKIDTGKNKVP